VASWAWPQLPPEAPQEWRVKEPTMPSHDFRISSYCYSGGCVAVSAHSDDVILVADSKTVDAGGDFLRFTGMEWDAFIAGVKNGEFDRHVLNRVVPY
jgi:Domain of unknown function (DUF397)